MALTIVSLLAERPAPELRTMQARLEAERVRNERERVRIDLELEQVTEAVARQSRPAAKPAGGRRTARPGTAQKLILDAAASLPQPMSPAQIIEMMESRGATVNRGTVHNAIARLVNSGRLHKLDVGQYQLASRNGSSGESHAGSTENEPGSLLSTVIRAQEAENE